MAKETQVRDAELESRLGIVRGLLAQGLSQAQIVRYIGEKCADWNISDRQARNYVYACNEQMATEAAGIDRAALVVKTLDRLDFLYGAAVRISDYKTALAVTAETVKLFHLSDPKFDGDWRKAAQEAGLSPSDLFERIVNAVRVEKEAANAANNPNG